MIVLNTLVIIGSMTHIPYTILLIGFIYYPDFKRRATLLKTATKRRVLTITTTIDR